VKQGLILEKETEKTLIWLSSMSESHWCYLFHKEVKSWDSTTWFRLWQFQTSTWKRYLQMHLLTERFFFRCDAWGFLKHGVKTYLMAPMLLHNSSTFFFFPVFASIVGPWSMCGLACVIFFGFPCINITPHALIMTERSGNEIYFHWADTQTR
jgi:hypothetical protein